MDRKLTVRINNKIVETARNYAKSRDVSLSKLIESYLSTLKGPDEQKAEITPLVKSLSGVIEVPENYDEKTDYAEFLIKKHQ